MHQPANNTPPQDQTRPIALVFDADYEKGALHDPLPVLWGTARPTDAVRSASFSALSNDLNRLLSGYVGLYTRVSESTRNLS